MAEKVLPTQLSGEEVIEAIADSVKVHLRKIGYPLRAWDAYDKFNAKVNMELQLWDIGSPYPVVTEMTTTKGAAEGEADGELKTDFEMPALAPNELRQSTGQGIPIQTQDENGHKVIKHVKYTRKGSAIKPAIVALLLLCVVPFLSAQPPAKPVVPPPVVETLSHTEIIARDAIMAEQNKAQADGTQFVADVAKAHPGYHYDLKTNLLTKDEPVKAEPKK